MSNMEEGEAITTTSNMVIDFGLLIHTRLLSHIIIQPHWVMAWDWVSRSLDLVPC